MSKKKLIKYSYSRSGDMRGSFYGEEIILVDDNHAVLKCTSQNSYNATPEENRIDIDASVLEEIGKLCRRYHMKRWQRRKISRMFIADGASHSYDFYFEGGKSIRFSSQHYPAFYRKRINKITEAVNKYKKPV